MAKVNKAIKSRLTAEKIEKCITWVNKAINESVNHREVFEINKQLKYSRGLTKIELFDRVNEVKELIKTQRQDIIKEASKKFDVMEEKISQIIYTEYEAIEEFI
jgi:hypothetical protein